jgi:thermitase
MKRISIAALAVAIGTSAQAGEFIVKTKGSFASVASAKKAYKVLDTHESANLVKISIDDKKTKDVIAGLFKSGDVEYVVPNFKLHRFEAPLDVKALKDQWAIKKVRAEEAWAKAGNKGNKKVLVAVIDTGVDYTQESLQPNMVTGYDYRNGDSDPMDETSSRNPGHGTHCAGIIGATGLIEGGTVGISPEVSIMPLRFLGSDGSGDLMNGIKAIDHAIKSGASVISASWGAAVPTSQAQPLIEAVKRASDAGVIFVAAAANDGKNNDSVSMYPANAVFENTITVAASNSSDAKPSWSNYGRKNVHVSSPGDTIMSTLPGNKYDNLSGTSMATPLVSGLVALLKAQDEKLTGAQARAILQVSGAKVAIETACNCRVDALAAVETVLEKKMVVVPSAGTIAPNEKLSFTAMNGVAPFTFASSNPAAATIDSNGVLTGVAQGQTTVTLTDATGKAASTLDIYVGTASSQPDPGNPGDPGLPPGLDECPFQGDQAALCEIICQIMPDMPFCSKR